MNLTSFMKEVDALSGCMSAESIAAFLHDHARSIPEWERERFLERLASFKEKSQDVDQTADDGGQTPLTGEQGRMDRLADESLDRELEENSGELAQIEEGELSLEQVLDEEYDDWYDREEEEFFYEDPQGIERIVGKSCQLVHTCVDHERYHDAYVLASRLLGLTVVAYGEYGGEDLTLEDLVREELLALDYKRFVLEALIAAYWGNASEERPEALYRVLEDSRCDEVTLEMLMQESQEELDAFPAFLTSWIGYLGQLKGGLPQRLMQEAVALTGDPGDLLDVARRYPDCHPGLYIQVLEQCRDSGQDERLLEIGREALERIPSSVRIRSRAAFLTAEAALKLGAQAEAEMCWLEAFRSEPCVTAYLRLLTECRDQERGSLQKEAEKIYGEIFSSTADKEKSWYTPERKTYLSLLFFSGRPLQMVEEGMGEDRALGWSSTFMKEGMALLFLYLYEGETLLAGCREMCRRYVAAIGFRREDYQKGTHQEIGPADGQTDALFFWERFVSWRRQAPSISEADAGLLIKKLEDWVQKRVDKIMEKSRRNYYGECAAFIAALGEVEESWGQRGGKAALMESYRGRYSRRRAFHQEMRAYGYRG